MSNYLDANFFAVDIRTVGAVHRGFLKVFVGQKNIFMFTNSYRNSPTVDVEALGSTCYFLSGILVFVHEIVHVDLTYTCPVINALS